MAGNAFIQKLVIGIRGRRHELQSIGMQPIPSAQDIVGAQRHMLYSLASVLLDEFLDLIDLPAVRVELRFIDRNSNLAARRGQGAARQTGVLAGDVEILVLTKVEYAVIEIEKMIHSTLGDVMRQVVYFLKTDAGRGLVDTRLLHEVDVIDRRARVSIDQVDQASADALDRRNVQLHRANRPLDFPGSGVDRVVQCASGVLDAKRHGAGAWPMLAREPLRQAVGFGVDDEIDIALAVKRDFLGAVTGDTRKAHGFE